MRSTALSITLALVFGGAAAVGAAVATVNVLENTAQHAVSQALAEEGHAWASAEIDGLRVTLTGTAPDEAARFAALGAASGVVDAGRLVDRIDIAASEAAPPPPFSVEILRNDGAISLIGLVPADAARADIAARAGAIAGATVTDLLEPADYPIPENWDAALDLGLDALAALPRAKITIDAAEVLVTGMAEDAADRERVEAALRAAAPPGVTLGLAIAAPRPVLTPFTLRFVSDADGARMEACSADGPEAQAIILHAARAAGLAGEADCRVGLGQPSPRWAEAARLGIRAVADLGGGAVTFSDADVMLEAPPGTDPALFDRIAGELDAALPDAFSLTTHLPEPPPLAEDADTDRGTPLFVATRSTEGAVTLRGRLPDARSRAAVLSLAQARFGVDQTTITARLADDLPEGWPVRVLVALEAFSLLDNGTMTVRPDAIRIAGDTGKPDAHDAIVRLVTERLGGEAAVALDVTYVEALDPVAALPTAEECVEMVAAAIADRKITFAPGSTEIEADALRTIDRVAEVLRECESVKMEIGGHTDSQGRESMNERLSQARANAVLEALMARRVLTANLSAKGYGESTPIADNGTEVGREANRRIEFRLVAAEMPEADAEPGAEPEAEDAEAPVDE